MRCTLIAFYFMKTIKLKFLRDIILPTAVEAIKQFETDHA
jgi:hypothetical protein